MINWQQLSNGDCKKTKPAAKRYIMCSLLKFVNIKTGAIFYAMIRNNIKEVRKYGNGWEAAFASVPPKIDLILRFMRKGQRGSTKPRFCAIIIRISRIMHMFAKQ